MQVDTGSQVTIIPSNFWEFMSKPKLQKCYLRLKQFDGTIIKVLGEFEATLKTKSKINIVRIIVAGCTKNHGLIGRNKGKCNKFGFENIFHKMAGMKYFAKIDLKRTYHQIEIDKETQEITTVNSPIGLLRWTCLPFGIKTASAIFQKAKESVVGDIIPNMIIFQDDICVAGKNAEELKFNLKKILNKLEESGMVKSKSKSVMEKKSLSFLFFISRI